ncbi:ABC transporter substrate-binding protein [Caproiciproducens sp.]|uniref:ABC transporter substrate-binding protein n=1 Tax=Caproiciproducens sp. TaxID=1954376 RepID=UPI002896E596|nr:ABC transporter substrate-binding protein [Caproiciproducens sp.]
MKRRLLSIILVLALSVSLLSGCAQSGDSTKSATTAASGEKGTEGKTTFGIKPFAEAQTLSVGYFAGSALSIPFYIADKEGFFKELNINIEYQSFTNGPAMMEANKNWDIAGAGASGVLVGMLGHDTPMIGVADYEDNQGIFVRKDSKIAKDPTNPDNWKGTTWLYPVGTTAHFTLATQLEKLGLSMSDIKSVNMDVSSALNAFNGGQGDGLAVWHAFALTADSKGYMRVSDAGKLGMTNVSCLVATRDALKSKRELLTKAWAVYYKTVEWINASDENKQKAIQYYNESCEEEGIKCDENVAKSIMGYYKGPTFDQSIELMTKTSADSKGLYTKRPLVQSEKDLLITMDFFIKLGKYKDSDRVKLLDNGLVDSSIAKEAKTLMDSTAK